MLSDIGQHVVYLRPQADYIESLYAELAFASILTRFCAEGVSMATTAHSSWTYAFDYRGPLDPFAKAFGTSSMRIRLYRAHRQSTDLLNDFISVISPDHGICDLDFRVGCERHNHGWASHR
jgi:hypothetical protein